MKKYEEVMQKLYNEAGKYPDQKLAKAVGDVRDMVVELRNMVGVIDSTREARKVWMLSGYDRTTDMDDTLFFDSIDEAKEYVYSNPWFLVSDLCHLNHIDKRVLFD